MDDCAGMVLAALRNLGMERDTIVIYTSDHGEMLGEHGMWQKFEFYESSCGVPLIIRAPGVSQIGVCEAPVSQVSLLPTVAELCGVPVKTPNDGVSFRTQLQHPEVPTNRAIFAEYNLKTPKAKYLIRDGEFKYSYWCHDIAELYDLRTDPHELTNLAAKPEYRDVVARMKAQLFAWYTPPE